ncbi:hypothetical protein [Plantactinospora mayteni]|uniref:hypothetical protein n=1 Tax=Plantactinospora mayteni TaxID=566021 RepID=UPI00194560B7|nr:hypothetical protein [Plantactinospora mayteni]
MHTRSRLYDVLTSHGGRFAGTGLDTRVVAYPLWTAGTATAVATALLGAAVVRRISNPRRPT